jgi:hypothetical protein
MEVKFEGDYVSLQEARRRAILPFARQIAVSLATGFKSSLSKRACLEEQAA